MLEGVAVRCNGARKFEPHQRAEFEAVSRAGREHPALAAGLLDDEALVLGDGIEADLEAVGAPGLEALEQAAAALEQRPDLVLACLAPGIGIAAAAELVIADLEAAALHRRHEVKPDIAGLLDDHRPLGPRCALVLGQLKIDDDLARRHQTPAEI